jgi:hypothetical protein
MRAIPRKGSRLLVVSAVCTLTGLLGSTVSARAQHSSIPQIHPELFAGAPAGASKPDDITKLGRLLYVTYQNNAGKDGSPPGSMSTIVAFDPSDGAVVAKYSVTGRCDGLTADPVHHRLLASVNEDNNSSLYVITPGHPTPAHYLYSPDPSEMGSDGSNGGTDAISVSPDGTIYVAHSNPDTSLPPPNNTAAVYTMTLSGTTATLTPFFRVNDQADVVNPTPGGAESAPLGLTDPDSNRFVPGENGGMLIQDAQADSKLVLASNLGEDHPTLRQLNLTNATEPPGSLLTPQLDDIERVTGRGTLYAVDQKTGNIYAIDTSGVEPGTFFVSQPSPSAGDLANDPALGVVDLQSGVVTHVDSTLGSPKGLLFVPAHERYGGADE